jgi:L-iditol 2-dehydrogenase
VRPRPGERVAVVGDGTVGLIAAHLLRLFSPAALVVVGQRPDQAGLAAALAAALGATAFALAGPAVLEGRFDLVVEAAGATQRRATPPRPADHAPVPAGGVCRCLRDAAPRHRPAR